VGTVAAGVTVLVLVVAVGLQALGVPWAWVVYPLGFGGLLPLALGVAGRYEHRERNGRSDARRSRTGADRVETAEERALEALRRGYARGAIDEAEFERRLERLLETETIPDVREYLERGPGGRDEDRDRVSGTGQ
jgi:uncharacterized membrane protein